MINKIQLLVFGRGNKSAIQDITPVEADMRQGVLFNKDNPDHDYVTYKNNGHSGIINKELIEGGETVEFSIGVGYKYTYLFFDSLRNYTGYHQDDLSIVATENNVAYFAIQVSKVDDSNIEVSDLPDTGLQIIKS